MLVLGGVIPERDFAALQAAGVEAIFPPGTSIAAAATEILEKLNEKRGYAQRSAALNVSPPFTFSCSAARVAELFDALGAATLRMRASPEMRRWRGEWRV